VKTVSIVREYALCSVTNGYYQPIPINLYDYLVMTSQDEKPDIYIYSIHIWTNRWLV